MPIFDQIPQSAADILLLPVSENKGRVIEIVFNLDLVTVIGM